MDGIEILNQTEILTKANYVWILMLVAIIGIIGGFLGLYNIAPKVENKILQIVTIFFFTIITMGSVIGLLVASEIKESTGKYIYQVTIDNSVSFNKFNEKYEIIDQEGKIFTVKERK